MNTNQIKKMNPTSKSGFLLFYVMGTLALLSLAAMISLNSARLESRTARNHYDAARAMYHAEAGVTLTKAMVEERLQMGESLSNILASLKVSPPNGVDFDEITEFREIVPERIFSFESIGRSNHAKASVVVHYRRQPRMTLGLFGYMSLDAGNHVSIYGYDSRYVINPTPNDNNGGASIGSNYVIKLASNNFTFNGSVLLGETGEGLDPDCTNCESSDYTMVHVGYVDKDPLGLLDDGPLSQEFDSVIFNNDNASAEIYGDILNIANRQEVTLTSGDYYLTSVVVGTHGSLTIDSSEGPVRIFLDGGFHMSNHTELRSNGGSPQDFQIFSKSSEMIRVLPHGGLGAFIYAPLAEFRLQPLVGGGDFKGNVWANQVEIRPHGNIYVDTSNANQHLSNHLELHAWYEQQGSF